MRKIVLASTVLALLASGALADWDPCDPHKMHWPQLPDPNGWDVRINNARRQGGEPHQWIVADDWQCTQSGRVRDIHIWVSWHWDMPDQINNIHLSIHDDVPDPDGNGPGYSKPGEMLWDWDFAPFEFTIRDWGTGDQGWYDAPFEEWEENDHLNIHQINFDPIFDPFEQQDGNVYWLDVSVDLKGEGETGDIGWKTSQDHWNDDAVYWDMIEQDWKELLDPNTRESLDMAFVITPEPMTLALVALGGAALLRRRRR